MKLKLLSLLTAVLLTGQLSAQIETYNAPLNPWNAKEVMPVAVYKPVGYNDSVRKKWPTIIFYHGAGEKGTDITRVTSTYLFKRIQSGWEPQAVNPITGQLEKFIVIAAQDRYGTPWPDNFRKVFDWLVKGGLRVDSSRIYTTGLSYGGAGAMLAATWDAAAPKMVAAVASLSPQGDFLQKKQNIPLLADEGVPVWFYTGQLALDGFTAYANEGAKILNAAGGDAFVQIFNGGHDGRFWNDFYAGNVKREWNGKQLNVYEWFLAHKKGGYSAVPPVVPEVPVDTTSKVIQILHDPARVQKIIILDKDGTWTEYQDSVIISGRLKMEMR